MARDILKSIPLDSPTAPFMGPTSASQPLVPPPWMSGSAPVTTTSTPLSQSPPHEPIFSSSVSVSVDDPSISTKIHSDGVHNSAHTGDNDRFEVPILKLDADIRGAGAFGVEVVTEARSSARSNSRMVHSASAPPQVFQFHRSRATGNIRGPGTDDNASEAQGTGKLPLRAEGTAFATSSHGSDAGRKWHLDRKVNLVKAMQVSIHSYNRPFCTAASTRLARCLHIPAHGYLLTSTPPMYAAIVRGFQLTLHRQPSRQHCCSGKFVTCLSHYKRGDDHLAISKVCCGANYPCVHCPKCHSGTRLAQAIVL